MRRSTVSNHYGFSDRVSHEDGAQGSWLELCQVYTSYPADAVLGHVLIPSLSPYVSSSRPVCGSLGSEWREDDDCDFMICWCRNFCQQVCVCCSLLLRLVHHMQIIAASAPPENLREVEVGRVVSNRDTIGNYTLALASLKNLDAISTTCGAMHADICGIYSTLSHGS